MCKRSPTVTHTLSWSPYEPNIFATCLLSYGQCDIVRAQQYDRRFQIPEMARTSSSHWKKSKMICCILPSSSDAQCFETARKFMAAQCPSIQANVNSTFMNLDQPWLVSHNNQQWLI